MKKNVHQPFQRLIGTLQVVGGKVFLLGTPDPETKEQAMNIVAGMGDGIYEVFGTFMHVPDMGYRLSSLHVQFFTKEELDWIQREQSELPQNIF